ncbi:MAG: glycosyltransferase, partial [Chthoniobacterales bacterium]
DITQSGWVSDRAAVYLAFGRPVITERTGIEKYLPEESGFLWMHDRETAAEAARRLLLDWDILSKSARACAVEYFDAPKNLRKILGLNS